MPRRRGGVEDHPGPRLAARAAVGVVVRADDDLVERELSCADVVDRVDLGRVERAPGDVGLVGDARSAAARPPRSAGTPRPRRAGPRTRSAWRGGYGHAVDDRGPVEHPVAVEEDGRPHALRAHSCPPRASASIARHRLAQRLGATPPVGASPAPRIRSVCEPHDRDVALPAAVAAGVLELDVVRGRGPSTSIASSAISRDGDVVAGGDVEGVERPVGPARRAQQHGVDDVVDVDVGLALRAVAEDRAAGSGRRAAGARSRSRRRGSGAGRRRCRTGTRGRVRSNMWA